MKKSWKIAFIRQGNQLLNPLPAAIVPFRQKQAGYEYKQQVNKLTFDCKVDVTASLSQTELV